MCKISVGQWYFSWESLFDCLYFVYKPKGKASLGVRQIKIGI